MKIEAEIVARGEIAQPLSIDPDAPAVDLVDDSVNHGVGRQQPLQVFDSRVEASALGCHRETWIGGGVRCRHRAHELSVVNSLITVPSLSVETRGRSASRSVALRG